MKKTLVLITHNFEEIETITPLDLLHRAGISTTIAGLGLGENCLARGRSGLEIRVNVKFEALAQTPEDFLALANDYDALLLPGGPGTFDLLKDGRAVTLASAFATHGKLIAAICAAPLILNAAGLLNGKRVAAHVCAWDEIPAAKNSARVEFDGNILTSRGAGTTFDFGLQLIRVLAGEAVSAKISAETMN